MKKSINHWESIYADKGPTAVSWYQQHPQQSLDLIKATGVGRSAEIIDIGGGASTLVDDLLLAGYRCLTVLDLSITAIAQAKTRLGPDAEKVVWLEQDVLDFTAQRPVGVWHDRAVFHFMTESVDRVRYIVAMSNALAPGSHVIMATFGLDGPERCSGLEIVRYSPETLARALGQDYKLIASCTEEHQTPDGNLQNFNYCHFVKDA